MLNLQFIDRSWTTWERTNWFRVLNMVDTSGFARGFFCQFWKRVLVQSWLLVACAESYRRISGSRPRQIYSCVSLCWQQLPGSSRSAAPPRNRNQGHLKIFAYCNTLTTTQVDTSSSDIFKTEPASTGTYRHSVFDDQLHEVFFNGSKKCFTGVLHQRNHKLQDLCHIADDHKVIGRLLVERQQCNRIW